jgi:hypothetical protein
LKSGPARRVGPGRVEEKTREGKTRWVDPATRLTGSTGPGWRKNEGRKNLVGWPGQNPVANPLTFIFFVFLLKRCRFDLKKNWPNDPVKTQNLNLGPDRILKLWSELPWKSNNALFFLFLFYIKNYFGICPQRNTSYWYSRQPIKYYLLVSPRVHRNQCWWDLFSSTTTSFQLI